eukprot:GHVQ01021917.1.p1 GENE.GHVQ01021917.1~~GHVQ01021917.1.p1  ORF type:complete len:566 (+),score=114.12 GHVQ01021917.1:104-1801(+)
MTMGLENVEIEYIAPKLDEEDNVEDVLKDDKGLWNHFQGVFDKFSFKQDDDDDDQDEEEATADFLAASMGRSKGKGGGEDDDESEDDDEDKGNDLLSSKQKRVMSRPSLAALKTWCSRPEVVEVWDCTASDPRLLVWLKGYRNTIQVPPHWAQKRKYMQGKRGIDKAPFRLPEYIEATKISEIRSALQEKEAAKSLKQKQREKVRPKMHRMDIDYETLHDAFFKYATKPKMTKFGDIYYEGKELELRMRRYETGQLSDRLKEALGIGDNAPPPWLINMQRYGPPPSYPAAKISGLNAPIPAGAQYGYHPGGWGKPPVDEYGRPLYGDYNLDSREEIEERAEDGKLWGELGSEDEEEEEYEEDTASEQPSTDGMKTPATGMDTPSSILEGTASVGSVASGGGKSSMYTTGGLLTPQSLDITKRGLDSTTPKAYTVLHQQQAPAQPGALFQSSTIYKMPGSAVEAAPLLGGSITPLGGTISVGAGGVVTPLAGGAMTLVGGTITPYVSGMQSVGAGGAMTPQVGVVAPLAGGAVTPQVEAGKRKIPERAEEATESKKPKKNKKEFKF